jgi:signal transduction histidine kinase
VARSVWADVAPDRAPLGVDGPDVAVRAPERSLEKIFVHVLDNAAKYGDGPTAMTIEVAGDRVCITVDSPGVEVSEISMLTEPFFRGERAVMRCAGLGVGLPVARALAEHAGGSLTVEAREGGGLITVVELEKA